MPPVANHLYGDNGEYCFSSSRFKQAFPHQIALDDVLRQDDFSLIQCINELESGQVSDDSIKLLRSLDRPLDAPPNAIVHLFAQKMDVEMFNELKLSEHPGEEKVFRCKDKKYLNVSKTKVERHIKAPRCVRLKLGSPVMLTYNIDIKKGLVNGLCGTVSSFSDRDTVIVNFGPHLADTEISVVQFTLFDPTSQKISFLREQIPLALGYAITIHKAQGMSIPFLDIDCDGIFAPGQLAVAVGRAITISGLRVRNFSPHSIISHPVSVQNFYDSLQNEHPHEKLICCHKESEGGDLLEVEALVQIPAQGLQIDINLEGENVEQTTADMLHPILPIDKSIFTFDTNSECLTELQKEMLQLFGQIESSPKLIIVWNYVIDFARVSMNH